jgi:hypothetical protein
VPPGEGNRICGGDGAVIRGEACPWVTEEGEMAAEARRGGDFPVGMKVLVVDDDPTSLLVLKRMLDECRYDGKQAAPHPTLRSRAFR